MSTGQNLYSQPKVSVNSHTAHGTGKSGEFNDAHERHPNTWVRDTSDGRIECCDREQVCCLWWPAALDGVLLCILLFALKRRSIKTQGNSLGFDGRGESKP